MVKGKRVKKEKTNSLFKVRIIRTITLTLIILSRMKRTDPIAVEMLARHGASSVVVVIVVLAVVLVLVVVVIVLWPLCILVALPAPVLGNN